MNLPSNIKKIFSLIMWLIALHSFCAGMFLIFLPESYMPVFGFAENTQLFFRMQGGVFHIVMAIIYGIAAINVNKYKVLITVSIIAKLIATIFLFSYFILEDRILLVLMSGTIDFLMALIMWRLQNLNRKAHKIIQEDIQKDEASGGGDNKISNENLNKDV